MLIVTVFVSSAHAQTPSSLQGKVFDPSNAVIVGASITAIPTGRTNGPTAVSNQEGLFVLSLDPGKYTIKISARDFLEISEPIEIGSVAQTRDFMLHLAGVRQSVDVKVSGGV